MYIMVTDIPIFHNFAKFLCIFPIVTNSFREVGILLNENTKAHFVFLDNYQELLIFNDILFIFTRAIEEISGHFKVPIYRSIIST